MKKQLLILTALMALTVSALALSPAANNVMQLVQAKVGDSVILAYIQQHPGYYGLTADDIIGLKQQGASSAVLNAMLSASPAPTPEAPAPQPVQAVQPAPAPAVTYVQQPTVVYTQPSVVYTQPYYPYTYAYPYAYSYPSVSLGFYWGSGGGNYHGWNGGGGYHGYYGGGGSYHGGGYHGH